MPKRNGSPVDQTRVHTMAYDDTNVFAKILRGEIPCHKVHEDTDTIVFMDIMPQSRGHALVVPKATCRNLLDADPDILARTVAMVQSVARAAMTAFSAGGVSVMQFNESTGGQTVFHLHFHVIPRYEGEALRPHAGQATDMAAIAADAALLRRALEQTARV